MGGATLTNDYAVVVVAAMPLLFLRIILLGRSSNLQTANRQSVILLNTVKCHNKYFGHFADKFIYEYVYSIKHEWSFESCLRCRFHNGGRQQPMSSIHAIKPHVEDTLVLFDPS